MLFAVIAGAGTALSPCVLPILPALLSAGATGGRRRPLGIVLGLTVTFTITIVGIAELVDGVGLGTGALRTVAVFVLLGFGTLLLAPRLADRLEAWLSPLIRYGPRTGGDGCRLDVQPLAHRERGRHARPADLDDRGQPLRQDELELAGT